MDKSEIREMLSDMLDSVDELKNSIEEVKEEFDDCADYEEKYRHNIFRMSLAEVEKLVYGKLSALVFHPGDLILCGKLKFRVLDVGNIKPINARPDEKHVLLRLEGFITGGTPFDRNGCNEWEKSSIRKYLNGDFLNMLSAEDQAVLKYVELHTGKADVTTTDRVFLLSAKELGFDVDETGKALPYFTGKDADERRQFFDEDGDSRWYFTRSPIPGGASYVRYVHTDGSLNHNGAYDGYGAAPACIVI